MPRLKTAVVLIFLLLTGGFSALRSATWPDYQLRGANLGVWPGSSGGYTEADIAHLALDWRANAVRVLINDIVPATWPYKVEPQTRDEVYRVIDLCLKYHLLTVPAFSASFDDNDNLFSNLQLRAAYKDFWVEVATHYAGQDNIAYDLMNEPHDVLAQTQWSAYARELTTAIRQVDTSSTIVIECPEWGWPDGFSYLTPTGDANTVYSFHFYGPMDFTHQRWGGAMMATPESEWKKRVYPGTMDFGWSPETWDKAALKAYVDKAVAFRNRYKVRLWCGEFGCARWALGADRWFEDWISLLEAQKIDWTYYAYREWRHMDIEMDPAERVNPTPRSETALVRQFKGYFALNEVSSDFDRDGRVGVGDAVALVRFLRDNPGNRAADLNHDGKPDLRDLLSLLLALARSR